MHVLSSPIPAARFAVPPRFAASPEEKPVFPDHREPLSKPSKKPEHWLVNVLRGRAVYMATGFPTLVTGFLMNDGNGWGGKVMGLGAVLTAMGLFRQSWSVKMNYNGKKIDLTPKN